MLSLLTNQISLGTDHGKYTGTVFTYLSKAFDMIDHCYLQSKIKCYSVKQKELCWFESYLFGQKQYVLYNNTNCKIKSVLCDVPQGSIPRPFLFILLMHQMHQCQTVLEKYYYILIIQFCILQTRI